MAVSGYGVEEGEGAHILNGEKVPFVSRNKYPGVYDQCGEQQRNMSIDYGRIERKAIAWKDIFALRPSMVAKCGGQWRKSLPLKVCNSIGCWAVT